MEGTVNIDELVERRNRSAAEHARIQDELQELDDQIARHLLADTAWEIWRDYRRLQNPSLEGDTLPERFMQYLHNRIDDEGTRDLLGLPPGDPTSSLTDASDDVEEDEETVNNRVTEDAPETPAFDA